MECWEWDRGSINDLKKVLHATEKNETTSGVFFYAGLTAQNFYSHTWLSFYRERAHQQSNKCPFCLANRIWVTQFHTQLKVKRIWFVFLHSRFRIKAPTFFSLLNENSGAMLLISLSCFCSVTKYTFLKTRVQCVCEKFATDLWLPKLTGMYVICWVWNCNQKVNFPSQNNRLSEDIFSSFSTLLFQVLL